MRASTALIAAGILLIVIPLPVPIPFIGVFVGSILVLVGLVARLLGV